MSSRAPAFTRDDLEHMKRAEIQKLCKDYGVKANLKTESLIGLLLDTVQHSNLRPLATQHKPPAATTSANRRQASTRLRTTSHAATSKARDLIERVDDEEGKEPDATSKTDDMEDAKTSALPLPTRTRKANETQRRLGVGRPAIAGGSGARAITKSSGNTSKRTKSTRSVKPIEEETIQEEREPSPPHIVNNCEVVIETSRNRFRKHDSNSNLAPSNHPPSESPALRDRLAKLEAIVNSTTDEDDLKHRSRSLKPILEKTKLLNERLEEQGEEITGLRSELQALKTEVTSLGTLASRLPTLEEELNSLREKLAVDTYNKTTEGLLVKPTTPVNDLNARSPNSRHISIPPPDNNPSIVTPNIASAIKDQAQPVSSTRPTLGKRRRDSATSNITGVIEANDANEISEKNLAKTVLRPNKKRPKLTEDEGQPEPVEAGSSIPEPPSETQTSAGTYAMTSPPPASGLTGNNAIRGEAGTPPPTAHLPEFFGASLDQSASADPVATVDEPDTVPEPVNPLLNFSFSAPTTSTPIQSGNVFRGLPPFTPGSVLGYPGNSNPFGASRASGSRARTPLSSIERIEEQFVHPNALMRPRMPAVLEDEYDHRLDRHISHEVGEGLPVGTTLRLDDSPARPMKKTMYGTELADDTRFGDFGRDGVASGSNNFWTGGRW